MTPKDAPHRSLLDEWFALETMARATKAHTDYRTLTNNDDVHQRMWQSRCTDQRLLADEAREHILRLMDHETER